MTNEIQGFDEVMEKLKALQDAELRRATSRATRKALVGTRTRAKANARRLDDPKSKESIEKNIAIRVSTRRFRRDGVIKGSVGVRGGAKKKNDGTNPPGGDTWYWRFLEFGTSSIAPTPFMRRAINPNETEAAFRDAMAKEIIKEIKKRQ